MKTNPPVKTTNTVSTPIQQENFKNTRKTLKVLQESASDKENLAGRSRIIKDSKLDSDHCNEPDPKSKKVLHKSTQVGEPVVTPEDLTSAEEPSADYWRLLAENRGEALNDSLQENEQLKEHIESLEAENETYKGMIEESRCIVETLKEMMGYRDSDLSVEEGEEGRERA